MHCLPKAVASRLPDGYGAVHATGSAKRFDPTGGEAYGMPFICKSLCERVPPRTNPTVSVGQEWARSGKGGVERGSHYVSCRKGTRTPFQIPTPSRVKSPLSLPYWVFTLGPVPTIVTTAATRQSILYVDERPEEAFSAVFFRLAIFCCAVRVRFPPLPRLPGPPTVSLRVWPGTSPLCRPRNRR